MQSNKCKSLLEIPNLEYIESIDREELAIKLDKQVTKFRASPLNIFIQVNTSGENTKSGIQPNDCVKVVDFIFNNCKNLKFKGLMTIGEPDIDDPLRDFKVILLNCDLKYSNLVNRN